MRAVVVGAGIVGVESARALRRNGFDVALLDQGPIPHPDAATTDLSKLVRADYGTDTFHRDLMARAHSGWTAWNARFERPLYHETGLLVATDDPSPDGFEATSRAAVQAIGWPTRDVRWADHPAWRPYRGGYVSERAGWAESGAVLAALTGLARAEGVDVRPDAVVDVDHLEADVVVVAAGAWTPVLLPELADRIRPVGQPVFHLLPEDPDRFRPPHFLPWAADIARTGWYGFPATADGRVKIANHGDGVHTDPNGPRVLPADAEDRLRAFLRDRLPALADAPVVGTRLCLYSDTFDGDFLIDRHPDRPGVVVATGGSGHLFKFGPVLGDLVANVVLGGDPPPRYRWRALADRRLEAARARPQ